MSALLILAALSAHAGAAQLARDVLPAGAGSPEHRAHLALNEASDLELARVLTTATGQTVRFEQRLDGLPVLGASAALRVLPDGSVPFMASSLARGLRVDTTPELGLEEAVAAVGLSAYPVRSGRLAVLPMGEGDLVWDIRVATPGDMEQVLVDAHSGVMLARRSVLRDSVGRVYEENPLRTPDTSDLELVGLDSSTELTGFGGTLQILNHASGSVYTNDIEGSRVGPSEGEDFLFDPPDSASDGTDGFAQVNAWYHLSATRTYFEGFTGEDMSTEDWSLVVLTNYNDDYLGGAVDNAFFAPVADLGGSGELYGAPNLIVIGQGTKVDFAVDADVFVHESGHYLTNNAVGYNQGQLYFNSLGLSPWGGSVDEGISDYFAISHFDDPVLGEVSLASFGAERDLSEQDLRCPEDVVGEVHEDGKLIGQLGWALHEAYGQAAADDMIWGAITLMTSDSSFGDFAAGVQQIAEELLADGVIDSLSPLEDALAASGMDACDVVQELGEEPLALNVWGLNTLGAAVGVDCATAAGFASLQSFFHFSMETGADDLGLQVDAELAAAGGGDISWQLYLREGEPVGFKAGYFLPEVRSYDLASEVFTDDVGSVRIEGEDFTPGSTWYGVVISQSCPDTQISLTAGPLAEAGGDDAGGDDAGGDDAGGDEAGGGDGGGDLLDPVEESGGCGCASASPPSGLLALGMLGLGLLWRRRRQAV